jgi:flagellar basal-body rod protein FlgB
MSILFDPTTQGLAQALSLFQKRHEVLASNIANIETPGYRAHDLKNFDATLKEVFAAGEGEADDSFGPSVTEDTTAPARADGNTVDLELQMAKLSGNATSYLALVRILGKRLAGLRQIIEGTR